MLLGRQEAAIPGSVRGLSYGGGMADPTIEVIRSKRRKRTVEATLVDGRLQIRVPDGLSAQRETELIAQARERVMRKVSSNQIDLLTRARQLADRYDLPRPVRVEWSSRQMRRWGSCTPDHGHIRISNRLTSVPGWVLDSVLVHELAHLSIADHGPQFQELVDRYELAERAKGYLIAKSDGRTI
jgi:predicted metal-dependent hydrolase